MKDVKPSVGCCTESVNSRSCRHTAAVLQGPGPARQTAPSAAVSMPPPLGTPLGFLTCEAEPFEALEFSVPFRSIGRNN